MLKTCLTHLRTFLISINSLMTQVARSPTLGFTFYARSPNLGQPLNSALDCLISPSTLVNLQNLASLTLLTCIYGLFAAQMCFERNGCLGALELWHLCGFSLPKVKRSPPKCGVHVCNWPGSDVFQRHPRKYPKTYGLKNS